MDFRKKLSFRKCKKKLCMQLKYQFWRKSLRKNATLSSWNTFFNIFVLTFGCDCYCIQQSRPKVKTNMLWKCSTRQFLFSEVTSFKIGTLTTLVFFSNKRHGKKSYCNFMLSLYQKPYVLEIKLPYTKLFFIVTAISKINCIWCIGDENLYNKKKQFNKMQIP